MYIVVRKGECPNNFWIKPLGSNAKPKEVNRRQIFDVGTTQEGLVDRKEEEEREEEDQELAIPRYNLKVKIEVPSGPSHQYNLCPRPEPLPRKSKRVLTEAASLAQLAHQEVLVGNASVLQGIDAGTIPPQGVGDKQMMECHSQRLIGKGDISWGPSSLSSPTRIHLVDGTQGVAEVTPELVTYL